MKNQIKKTIFSLLASSAFLSTAFACAPNSLIDSPYVSAQFGVSDKPYANFESKKFTGRVAYGYLWNMNEQFQLGMEGGLNAYENAHYSYANVAAPRVAATGTLKRAAFDLLGVANFYASTRLDLFAKAGPVFTHQRFKYSSPTNQPVSSHTDKTALKLVMGVGYDINEQANIYLSRDFQTSHRHQPIERSSIKANATSIGIRYKFC